MSSIRLGMIGAGQIAGFTAREFAGHPHCDIVAVADPSSERAKALAGRVQATSVYRSAEALVEQQDVDAVYIAVPNAFHEAAASAALNVIASGSGTAAKSRSAQGHARPCPSALIAVLSVGTPG